MILKINDCINCNTLAYFVEDEEFQYCLECIRKCGNRTRGNNKDNVIKTWNRINKGLKNGRE